MVRYLSAILALAASAAWLVQGAPIADAQAQQQWANLKGRIVWSGDAIPARKEIAINVNAAHCLQANPTANAAKGTILEENLLIHAKNKGIKNVFVYILLAPNAAMPIHPDLKEFPMTVTVDQPACMFWPRAIGLRQGQTLVVQNTSPVDHNFRYIGDGVANQGGSIVIKAGKSEEIKGLNAQRLPLPVECNIHGWMKGRVGVFSHPYFAITDEDGHFEIKDAPVGQHQVMIYHEEIGYRLGRKGKEGEAVVLQAAGTDLGELKMGGK